MNRRTVQPTSLARLRRLATEAYNVSEPPPNRDTSLSRR